MNSNLARGRWLAGLVALLLPLLLAAPAAWILKRHAAQLRGDEQVLRREIQRLDAEIVEIEALDRMKATFLARKTVAEVLDEKRPRTVRLLNALGMLPRGVQLTSVTTRGDQVTLIGVAVVAIEEAVEALRAAGLDNVEVQPAATSSGGAAAPFEIHANFAGATRDDAAGPTP